MKAAKKNGLNKKYIYRNTVGLIFKNIFPLILGQSVFLAIIVFALTPLIPFVYQVTLKFSGFSYLTMDNMVRFLINPFTLLMLIFLFTIVGAFLLLEACFFVTFFSIIENGEKTRIAAVFFISLKRFVLTLLHKNLILIPYVWISMLFYNIPLILFVIKKNRLLSYSVKNYWNNFGVKAIFFILFILLFNLFIRRLFVYHYCLVEGRKYREARNQCKKISYLKTIKLSVNLLLWNLCIGIIVYIIYFFMMIVAALLIMGIPDKTLYIATFLSVSDSMLNFFCIIILIICTLANLAFITHLFYVMKKENNEDVKINYEIDNVFFRIKSYKRIISIGVILLIGINLYFFFDVVANGSPLQYVNLDMINITSHRGFSHDVPENTMAAIDKALEEQADYIEIDVRQTKDGELVLLHDESLKRTTGLNKKIWEVNYEDITQLDAGKWMGAEFEGIKIPTLREVFEECKGRINLNLDIKNSPYSDNLEEKVVSLIEEYGMEWQCVISSTSLSIIDNVKALNPDIKTGFITYQLYRGYYNNDNIDFFSLNAYFVTQTILKNIHEIGKEVHVWTVNSKHELLRMKRLGVDNIITDNPAYAKEVLYEEDSSRLLTTILKLMIEE